MKTLVNSLLAILVVFSVASCSKESSQETGANVITGSNFTADINGESWKADSLEQVLVTDSVVTISGLSGGQQELSLVLPTFAVGKYTLNASTAAYGLYTTLSTTATDVYLTNSSVEVAKAGGTVEITAIDTLNKTITGTFAFTAYRPSDQSTVAVTAGQFKALAYSITSTGGGTPVDSTIVDNGRDTLSVFIDGKFFVADAAGGGINGVSNDGVLALSGAGVTATEVVAINMPSDLSVGTHVMAYPTTTVFYTPDGMGFFAPVPPATGTFKILTNDQTNKRISGQFSFTGADATGGSAPSKKFTQGYFAVTYQ